MASIKHYRLWTVVVAVASVVPWPASDDPTSHRSFHSDTRTSPHFLGAIAVRSFESYWWFPVCQRYYWGSRPQPPWLEHSHHHHGPSSLFDDENDPHLPPLPRVCEVPPYRPQWRCCRIRFAALFDDGERRSARRTRCSPRPMRERTCQVEAPVESPAPRAAERSVGSPLEGDSRWPRKGSASKCLARACAASPPPPPTSIRRLAVDRRPQAPDLSDSAFVNFAALVVVVAALRGVDSLALSQQQTRQLAEEDDWSWR